jgi:prenyltransferase beta subunit
MAALGPVAPVDAGLWLAAKQASSLEDSLAAAFALTTGTPESLLSPVDGARAAEGQWAAAAGERPDPFHTSLALLVLTTTETASLPGLGLGAEYLISTQNADGSWSAGEEDGQEIAVTTALAVQALLATGVSATAPLVVDGRAWLSVNQNLDGRWGMSGSTPAVTAQVLSVLRWLGLALEVEHLSCASARGSIGSRR